MTKPYRPSQFVREKQPDAARHIAIVVHSLNPGGAQRRLVTLANAFAAAGRQVDFVALRGGGDVGKLLNAKVRFTVLTAKPKPPWKPWFFEGWGKLQTWLETHRPDAVLAGITTVHFTALRAIVKMQPDRPLLAVRASRHPERYFPWSRPFKRLFEPVERAARWRIYNEADLVIAVSRETAEALRSGMEQPQRCVEIANPVITAAFIESLRKDAPHPWFSDDIPVIVGVGRLAWQKRFDVLLDAVAAVRTLRPVRLIILGEGHLRRRLEAQVRRLGLGDSVAMPGWVADIGAWISRARMLVSTSAFEGSPAVLIEALAAGVPVVATDCPGGSQELLEDAAGGMLVPTADPDATAEAILAVLDEPRDAAALRDAVSRYTEEASAAAYLAALDRAVRERAGAAAATKSTLVR